MLRTIIVGAALTTGALGGIIGQTTSTAPFDWSSILGGALGSSPPAAVAIWRLSKADKDKAASDRREQEDKAKLLELVERHAVVLADATATIKAVQDGMAATGRSRRDDGDAVVDRLESFLTDLQRRRDAT